LIIYNKCVLEIDKLYLSLTYSDIVAGLRPTSNKLQICSLKTNDATTQVVKSLLQNMVVIKIHNIKIVFNIYPYRKLLLLQKTMKKRIKDRVVNING